MFEYSLEHRYIVFEKKMCICLDYFATHARMYDLQFRYDCAVGFVSQAVTEIAILFDLYLVPKVISWPDEEEGSLLAMKVNQSFDILLCIGMIDGTYIYCKGYGPTRMDYTCRKCDCAINLVLFMHHELRILHFISNNLGSEGDEDILDQ